MTSTNDTGVFSPAHHFTDTIRLPWIIESGELRPSTNRIGNYPRDFLWATTSESGDRTSSAMSPSCDQLYRDGSLQRVRLTLDAADFTSFHDITTDCPEWTSDHNAQLTMAAAAMGRCDTSKWLCRAEPLSLVKVVRAEAKSYAAGRWVEIDLSPGRCIARRSHPRSRGIVIGDHAYMARRELQADGNVAYDQIVRIPFAFAAVSDRAELAADLIRAEPEQRNVLEKVAKQFRKVSS
jgi:hypothetical protein